MTDSCAPDDDTRRAVASSAIATIRRMDPHAVLGLPPAQRPSRSPRRIASSPSAGIPTAAGGGRRSGGWRRSTRPTTCCGRPPGPSATSTAPARPPRVARGAWLAAGDPPRARPRAAGGARAAREHLARHAGDDVGEPAGAARRQRSPPAVAARRCGHRSRPHAAVRRDRGRRARAAAPAAPRRDAARAGARRPPTRVRGAAPRDRRDAGAAGSPKRARRACRDRGQAGRRPISATGAAATSARPAIAHQPES